MAYALSKFAKDWGFMFYDTDLQYAAFDANPNPSKN